MEGDQQLIFIEYIKQGNLTYTEELPTGVFQSMAPGPRASAAASGN